MTRDHKIVRLSVLQRLALGKEQTMDLWEL